MSTRFNFAPRGQTGAAAADDQSWAADRWVNLFLPNKAGTKSRVGKTGLALKLSDAQQKDLIEFLDKKGGTADEWLKNNLIIEYRSNERNPANGFKLD
jgi:hypothetical protein